jgi:hypothetical protein
VNVKHPVTKSLNVTPSYTWSHNTTNLAGGGVIDVYHVNRYHGSTESLNFPVPVNTLQSRLVQFPCSRAYAS